MIANYVRIAIKGMCEAMNEDRRGRLEMPS
jgi:hypothetical protein